MDASLDQLGQIRTEWHVLKERWFAGEPVDPVFEGIVRDFFVFDCTMQDIYKKVEVFMKGVDSLAEGLVVLSESTISGLTQVDDPLIKSDCCKMKEATNQITRADAPHSAIAKLRRDMDFNIMNPMRNHLINNRNLKTHLEKRRRRLLELNIAKKQYEDCVKKNYSRTDRRFLQAQASLESAKMSFHEVDKHIFEWLYILEEYKGDILDSALQTLKYLQYEFFATAAHAISGVLPARMEFRPMVEMTPEHLEAQVDMELQEAEENDEEVVTDFSVRLIEKLAKDNKTKPGQGIDSSADVGPAVPVDPLSLSSLLSQGFEEGPARQALRKHQNNTQAALDWLISGGEDGDKGPEDGVRMPTTVKRVQRQKARRKALQEKRRRQEEEEDDEEEEDGAQAHKNKEESEGTSRRAPASPNGAAAAGSTSPAPPEDLLNLDAPSAGAEALQRKAGGPRQDLLDLDEPPPPTDFSKEVETLPLPPMQSLDLTRCEKQPLPASVAAGTAQLRSLPQAGAEGGSPAGVTAPAAAAFSLAGLTAEQFAAAQAVAGQAQITPQQLLLAAQQLAAAQAQHGAQGQQLAAPVAPGSGGYPQATAPGPVPAQATSQADRANILSLDPLAP
jgi:hypothetical protein